MPEEPMEGPDDLEQPPHFFPLHPEESEFLPEEFDRELVVVSVKDVFRARTGDDETIHTFISLSSGESEVAISVGPSEAKSIHMAMTGVTPDRPLTHDLLKNVIDKLEGSVKRVVIDDMWSGTYYAKVYLDCDGDEVEVDSRPSDAIALAIRCNASIYIAAGLLHTQ